MNSNYRRGTKAKLDTSLSTDIDPPLNAKSNDREVLAISKDSTRIVMTSSWLKWCLIAMISGLMMMIPFVVSMVVVGRLRYPSNFLQLNQLNEGPNLN